MALLSIFQRAPDFRSYGKKRRAADIVISARVTRKRHPS